MLLGPKGQYLRGNEIGMGFVPSLVPELDDFLIVGGFCLRTVPTIHGFPP